MSELICLNPDFPSVIEVMKADGVDSSELSQYENGLYFAQEKYDGTRIITIKKNGKLSMMTRKWKNDLAPRYPRIANELKSVTCDFELDGELVFFNKETGKPEFVTALATDDVKRKYDIRLMLFDVINWNGQSMTDEQQINRTGFLLNNIATLRFEHITTVRGVDSGFAGFFDEVINRGGEGIILKLKSGKYLKGKTSTNWLKCKKMTTEDCVVLGITQGNNKYANQFGALVVGQYIDGKMHVVARVSGMNDAIREELNAEIRAMPKDTSIPQDFWKGSNGRGLIHTISPGNLVIECESMERFAKTHLMRHPRFVRVRDDKPYKECIYIPKAMAEE